VAVRRLYRGLRALPKSLIFCFTYLPWRDALRLPVVVSHTVCFRSLKGRVRLAGPARFGTVRIGFLDAPGVDPGLRTVWDVREAGEVVFAGPARIGPGAGLVIAGMLEVGDDVQLNARTTIVCWDRIVLGDRVAVAWECLIMDTDYHDINRQAPCAEVVIGAGVWVAARVTVLKGVRIAPGCILAANACVTRSFEEPRAMIAGNPARVVKRDVSWALIV
jgi:acetyltransferase-like isoleucine patch superfamily enzyme